MSIIYVLSIILIIGLHMLIYIKEEKQNFLKYFVLTLGLLLCYNMVICVILSFIKIKCTLPILSCINFIVAILFGFKINKDKKIQKYYINKMDIIALTSIFVIVLSITIKQYGITLNVKSSTTDGATHYLIANEFYHYSNLLIEENSDILGIWNEKSLMPGAYINTGLIFKIFSPLIEETYFCKLYTLFEISMWSLSGILMYVLLSNNKKEEKKKILPLIFSIIYMLGYPLHTLLSGFSYLMVGLNIIVTILLIMQFEETYYKYILMFFATFGLMFSYYYFAPVVFLAVFIQILIDIRNRSEKIFDSKNLLNIVISLIIPGLFGVMYFIIFQHIKYGASVFQEYGAALGTPGPIYKNLITTILIFALLGIYYVVYNLKIKKQNILDKMLIISGLLVVIAFIGMKLEKVSEYYYYKIYYMLWIYVIVGAFYGIDDLVKKRKILIYGGIGLYCVGILIAGILNRNMIFFDIFQKNFDEIKAEYKIISDKELELLQYYNNNIDTIDNSDDSTYVYVGGNARPRWMYALTKNPFIYIDASWGEPFTDIQQFFEMEQDRCIIFKLDNVDMYEKIDKVKDIKILFKNEAGVIIEKY